MHNLSEEISTSASPTTVIPGPLAIEISIPVRQTVTPACMAKLSRRIVCVEPESGVTLTRTPLAFTPAGPN